MHDEDELTFSSLQAEAVGLELVGVEPGSFSEVIRATGELVAPVGEQAVVTATSNGILSFARKDLTMGARISNGGALATISAEHIAEGDPQAKLRVQYERAERAFRRAELLIDEQLISQREYDDAKAAYETAKAAYAGLQSASTGAGITVSSPIAGFLTNRWVEEGAYVSVGQPLFTVAQNKRLQLRVDVSQRYQHQLASIRSANFKLPYRDEIYSLDSLNGRLLGYGQAAEPGSAFLPVNFELDNTGGIPLGSYAEVYLLTHPVTDVIVVPKSAIIEEQGTYAVMVRTGESVYRKQPVTLGGDNGLAVQLMSGVQPGDQVVSKGALHIKLANMNAAIPHGHSH